MAFILSMLSKVLQPSFIYKHWHYLL